MKTDTFFERWNLAIPQNRITAVLFLAQSFFSASTIAAFTLPPIIAAELTGSESVAGLPQTLTLTLLPILRPNEAAIV